MIRIEDFRCIVEKYDTHEKYYPKVLSFETTDEYPLNDPASATINVISNSQTYSPESISHVEFDDIIRLQVSLKYHISESTVWIDIFEGRIQNLSKEFGNSNTYQANRIELSCVGHLYEAFYALIESDQTFTGADARNVISSVSNVKLGRMTYDVNRAETGITITDYKVESQQVYVSDVFTELEKLSGDKWVLDVTPVYTALGNLQTCYLEWHPFSTVPTTKYKIIEGTPRLISATIDEVGDEVRTFRYVKGGTNETGVQYSGSDYDEDAVAEYGNRYAVDTFAWVKYNTLCNEIAGGLVSESKLPYIAGTVELVGTIDAKIGDLVSVKIPSLEMQGVQVNGNYTVYKVNHILDDNGFRTKLDIGRVKKSGYDYLAKNVTRVAKTCYKNQSKV